MNSNHCSQRTLPQSSRYALPQCLRCGARHRAHLRHRWRQWHSPQQREKSLKHSHKRQDLSCLLCAVCKSVFTDCRDISTLYYVNHLDMVTTTTTKSWSPMWNSLDLSCLLCAVCKSALTYWLQRYINTLLHQILRFELDVCLTFSELVFFLSRFLSPFRFSCAVSFTRSSTELFKLFAVVVVVFWIFYDVIS